MNLKDILAAKAKLSTPPSKEVLEALEEIELKEIKAFKDSLYKAPQPLLELAEEIAPRSNINDFIFTSEREESLEALECFLILYYKAHSKDVYIRQGEGACLLYEFLGCPISTKKYPPLPLGHSIQDAYVMHNILGLPHYVVYGIMEKINLKFQKI